MKNPINYLESNKELIIILLCGLLLRLWGLKASLPINFSDEEVYVVGALRVGQGDFNPHDFNNPSLMIYVNFILFGLYFIVGKLLFVFHNINEFKDLFYENPTSFYWLARFLTVMLAISTIIILYKLVKLLYGERLALIASGLLAVYPYHVYASQSAKCDVAMVFLIFVSLFYLMKFYEEDQKIYFFVSCFVCGLAISTKYSAAPLSVTCVLACLLKSRPADIKHEIKSIMYGIILIFLGFFLATPFALLDFRKFFKDVLFLLAKNKTQWFGMEGLNIGLIEYLFKAFPVGSGWTIYIFTLLGIVFCFKKFNKKEIILFSFPLLLFVILAQTRHVAWNYALPLYPFFCIIAALFLGKIQNHVRSGFIWLFILTMIPPISMITVNDYNKTTIDTRFIAKQWIQSNIPADKKIASESAGFTNLLTPNEKRIHEILDEIKDPQKGGQFRYYLKKDSPKSYYIYEFPLFEREDRVKTGYGPNRFDDDCRKCTKPNLSDYNFENIKQKYDYMILSSYSYLRFKAFPSLYPKQNDFYNSISDNSILLKQFNNYDDSLHRNGSFCSNLYKRFGLVDHQGPTIKIYQLNI